MTTFSILDKIVYTGKTMALEDSDFITNGEIFTVLEVKHINGEEYVTIKGVNTTSKWCLKSTMFDKL